MTDVLGKLKYAVTYVLGQLNHGVTHVLGEIKQAVVLSRLDRVQCLVFLSVLWKLMTGTGVKI